MFFDMTREGESIRRDGRPREAEVRHPMDGSESYREVVRDSRGCASAGANRRRRP